jgi:hypothetical protein
MSYDVWLTIDTGGPEPAVVGRDSWGYTSNCAPMWRAAGADLGEFDGKLAGDCARLLRSAIVRMKAIPATFEAMNPENGWGSYKTLVPALERLLKEFELHPLATVRVSR